MTWVQLTEQEAKMQQGWKDGHLWTIRIIHLFTFLWCIIKFPYATRLGVELPLLSQINIVLLLLCLGYLIKVIRSKNKSIITTFIAMPILITVYTSIVLMVVAPLSDVAISLLLSSIPLLFWSIILFLYSRISKAYRLNYLHQIKVKNKTP